MPIILAAGASLRMGRPKALLPLGGQTCLDVVVATAREAGCADAIVVVAPGTPVASAAAQLNGVNVVHNPAPERGPISSLQCGLRALPGAASAFLLWPVDHPLASSALVKALADAFRAGSADARIVIPSFERRRGHPVVMATSLAREVSALSGAQTAREVVSRHEDSIVYVDAPDGDCLIDLDTPDDYQHALVRFNQRSQTGVLVA